MPTSRPVSVLLDKAEAKRRVAERDAAIEHYDTVMMLDASDRGDERADELILRIATAEERLAQGGYDAAGTKLDDRFRVTDPVFIGRQIRMKPSTWVGRCKEIADKIVAAKLVPNGSKAVYGHWLGPISDCSIFSGRRLTHHGWIELPDGRIYDPTRWVFFAISPYIFVGTDDNEWYDFGGNRLREKLVDCSKPPVGPLCGKKMSIPAKYWDVLAKYLGNHDVRGEYPIEHLMWLANLPLARLGGDASVVYQCMIEIGMPGYIPIDNRRAVLGG